MENIDAVKTLLDLGLSAILLYFIFELWRDNKEKQKEIGTERNDRNEELQKINDKILEVIKENTRVQSELKGAIEANTKSTETLTSKIYDVLTRNGNK